MPDHGRYRQTRLEPAPQRLMRLWRRISGAGPVKRQRVYRVDLGEVSLKRIVFEDAATARELAHGLGDLRGLALFPELVAQQGSELWVDFLDGELVDGLDSNVLAELARIYATLYSRSAELRPLDSGAWLTEAEADLGFLTRAGVIGADLQTALRNHLVEQAPDSVWVGYDYSDPRPANLLACRDGRLRFIDVESLRSQALLGGGIAKACFRWLGDRRGDFLAELQKHPCPPVVESLPFVELVTLASWTKRSVLLRKRKLVRPALFEGLLQRP